MTNYLITGAARGIGRGFVTSLLQRPNSTVIAAVRTLGTKDVEALQQLPRAEGSSLHVVKIVSTSETDAKDAVAELASKGITKLDVVIANAGIFGPLESIPEISISSFREQLEVNALGPLILLQATLPLLKEAAKEKNSGEVPKFVLITSAGGSLEMAATMPMPVGAYGGSKAAANFWVRKANFEIPEISTLVINPGWVATDMGQQGAEFAGVAAPPVSVEDSVKGILSQVDKLTKESGGSFLDYDGSKLPW